MLASIKDSEIQFKFVLHRVVGREKWINVPSPCLLCPHFLEVLA